MLIFHAVVVVHMYRGNALAKASNRVRRSHRDMRMAKIQANAHIGQVPHLENQHQMLGRRGLAQQVFHQQAYAERPRKGAQVFQSGERILNGARRPLIVALAKVHHKIAQRDVLRRFKRTLDLVHGVDAPRLIGVQHIHCGCARAAHLAVGIKRCMHRKGLERVGAEPLGQLGHVLAAGVVEMLARGKNLHRLRAGALRELKQARMQTVIQKQMSRQNAQHLCVAPCAGSSWTPNRTPPIFSHFDEGSRPVRRLRGNPCRVSVSSGQSPRAHGLSSKLSRRAAAPIRFRGSERVDAVFWIEGSPRVPLAIVLCPYGGSILKDELREIARSGVQTLVSLLEPDEADWLGLAEEGAIAEQLGMHFISHPIQDVHVPVNVHLFRKFVSGLAERLRAGERIGMHCRGSIGRAPLTAACTMIHLGWDAKDALEAIQTARGYEIPDTAEQLRWVLKYKAQP